ncbi:VOC family protein [Dyadobacter chenwenxiniae]|uniref:VOC family protein n=1 Tax=Dyadobacter chenwenxiniae TaxID=2906456 RepID=A0A9X1THH0_9BACT|nr:VOC family protein [Dyadobacter chenwenxiniae]MCF0065127.1 VOC family protein [Dyadobacter chenwenxiniae]UON84601.1 VOC family protein [Dyadobacter chenwenxiniae]
MNNPIFPCLWFDNNAKAAAEFYCSVFKNSRIIDDTPLAVTFEINGSKMMGLNGGPQFKPTEAVSLVIDCNTQEEIDYYWDTLTADGGAESMCGWIRDKFGFSWQIVPSVIVDLLKAPERSDRVMAAVMKMKKLDLKTLIEA